MCLLFFCAFSMKRFAIIGDPVEHSLSPQLHKEVFETLGMGEECSYEFAKVTPEELENRINELKNGDFEGFSVTIPHKQSIIPFCDELTERAKKVGAVNTILRRESDEGDVIVLGDNTDYAGFKKALEEVSDLLSKPNNEKPHERRNPAYRQAGEITNNALVLGSGGAARAIIAVLCDHGFDVTVAARNPGSCEELSQQFKVTVSSYSDLDPNADWKLIVNTTPVGMEGKEDGVLLSDEEWYRKERVYADIIYTPRMTEFLKRAQACGAEIITGDHMFLWQAVEQATLFCKREDIPVKKMREVLGIVG